MPEHWQQWIPFHVDKWQGSANVQCLSDLAYRAVHNLLMDMWKSADCCLPLEDRELAKRSRVASRWSECREEVLEYFSDRTPDRKGITHPVLLREWIKARRKFEKNHGAILTDEELSDKRSEAGRLGASKRWQNHGKPIANEKQTDAIQVQVQGQVQKTNTTTLAVTHVPAIRGKLLGTLPLTGNRTYEVREDDLARDGPLYPGIDVVQEYREMKGWLLANPKKQKTPQGIRSFMHLWLSREQDKSRPGGGNGTYKGKTGQSIDAARAAIEEIENRRPSGPAWSSTPGEAGQGRLPAVCE